MFTTTIKQKTGMSGMLTLLVIAVFICSAASGSALSTTRLVDERNLGQGPLNTLMVRDDSSTKCSGFTSTSEFQATTVTKPMSDLIDCQNSTAPCSVPMSQQHSITVTESFSLDAGGSVTGLDVKSVFGSGYTQGYTIDPVNTTQMVPAGQCGFLTGAGVADVRKGTYTNCNGNGQNISGIAVLPLKDYATYSIATSTCSSGNSTSPRPNAASSVGIATSTLAGSMVFVAAATFL